MQEVAGAQEKAAGPRRMAAPLIQGGWRGAWGSGPGSPRPQQGAGCLRRQEGGGGLQWLSREACSPHTPCLLISSGHPGEEGGPL